MKAARRREVRRQTLRYLADCLHALPDIDGGLYDGLDHEESDFAAEISRSEGQRIRKRVGDAPTAKES